MPRRAPRPRSRNTSFEDQVATEVLKGWASEDSAIARDLGDAPETERLSAQEELELYAFEDSRYPDARALVTAGYSQEEATMLRFPYRMKAIRSGRPDPVAQVRAAKDLRTRYLEAIADGWEPPKGVPTSAVKATAQQGAPAVAEAEMAMLGQQMGMPSQQPAPMAPGMAPPQPPMMGGV